MQQWMQRGGDRGLDIDARDSGVPSPKLLDTEWDPLPGHCELILIIPVGLILRGSLLPSHFPPWKKKKKKAHFSGQRFPDSVPLNCENSPHNGCRGERETPKSFHSPAVTLGEAKEPSLIPGILLNILGLAAAPHSEPPLSLLLRLIQTAVAGL